MGWSNTLFGFIRTGFNSAKWILDVKEKMNVVEYIKNPNALEVNSERRITEKSLNKELLYIMAKLIKEDEKKIDTKIKLQQISSKLPDIYKAVSDSQIIRHLEYMSRVGLIEKIVPEEYNNSKTKVPDKLIQYKLTINGLLFVKILKLLDSKLFPLKYLFLIRYNILDEKKV